MQKSIFEEIFAGRGLKGGSG